MYYLSCKVCYFSLNYQSVIFLHIVWKLLGLPSNIKVDCLLPGPMSCLIIAMILFCLALQSHHKCCQYSLTWTWNIPEMWVNLHESEGLQYIIWRTILDIIQRWDLCYVMALCNTDLLLQCEACLIDAVGIGWRDIYLLKQTLSLFYITFSCLQR